MFASRLGANVHSQEHGDRHLGSFQPARTGRSLQMGDEAVELDFTRFVNLQYKRTGKLPECFSHSSLLKQIHFEANVFSLIGKVVRDKGTH